MTLLALQRDFQDWLTQEPAELPESFAERHRGGLAVYLNNYRSQLLACLAASFPVVRASIGEAEFEAAAAKHIDQVPPHSWTLDDYANGFPEMLAIAYADAPQIAELAQLELALAAAFVASDPAPLDIAKLAGVDWDAAVIHLSSSFVVLPVTSNVGEIWTAINAGETPPRAEQLAEAGWLAVWRNGFKASFRVIPSEERAVVAMVREGASFGKVCAHLVETLGEERGTAASGAMLGRWLADGVIVRVLANQHEQTLPD